MSNKAEAICQLRESTLPIIIVGAGPVGRTLLDYCRDAGIKVRAFCDTSNKVARNSDEFEGLEVYYTPDLPNLFEDALFLISTASISDAVDLLKSLGFEHWIAGGQLLDMQESIGSGKGGVINPEKRSINTCISCHGGYLDREGLFFRSIDLVITERCSLKCKDCSNLMQYYVRPMNEEDGVIHHSLDLFFDAVDEVMEVRIIGGDTFMNKRWPEYLERVIAEPKVGKAVLFTNGTIVPKAEEMMQLQHPKVLVVVTDYGDLSKKLELLKQQLDQYRIAYHVLEQPEWLDCAGITQHNRGEEGNKQIFMECCAKNMVTLSEGKIHRCPYAANVVRLKAAPRYDEDYVDLFELEKQGVGREQVKNMIHSYLRDIELLKVCDFCSGRPLSGVEVEAAVQIDEPLKYVRYD